MEKRRLTSLRSVLLQYLVRTALACLLVAVGWLLVLMLWVQNGGRVTMSNFYGQLAYQEGRERAVTDYISGMSDEFAIRTFEELFVPQKWHVL